MKKVICPICDRPMDERGPREWPDWPFCSQRCKLVDLGRWLGESYGVPGDARGKEESGEAPPSADPPAASDSDEV